MTVEESYVIKDDFPVGMRVLAVDDDPSCLKLLENLLVRCQYNVTTTTRAVTALKLLRENRDRFDLVISDVHMPDMDGFKLLELVGLEMDLPVIMLSANGERQVVMRGITHGACDYLLKPVRMQELRNIWQHVIRRRKFSQRQNDDLNNEEDSQKDHIADSEGSQWVNDQSARVKKKQKDQNEEGNDNKENIQENEDSCPQKKPRVVWSIELHQKFVAAVNQLGIDKAVPKKILDRMNVENLTREHVASHLQKYRLYLKRLSAVTGQHASIASALRFRNLSYVNMDSLDVFRNYHALGRYRQLPALTTSQPNGLLDGMHIPAVPGMHMPSDTAEPSLTYHNTGNPINDLGKHQDIRLTRNCQANLIHGGSTLFELGQFQQPKMVQEANSSSNSGMSGSGLTANLCGNYFANAANNLPLLQPNKQHLEHGGFGAYSSAVMPSLSADPFDIDLQDLSHFPHIGISTETWQYAVPSTEHSANTLPGCAPFSHENLPLCQIEGSSLQTPQVDSSNHCKYLNNVALTPFSDAQDHVNLIGGSMVTMPAGRNEDPKFPNIRSLGNSQQEWHHPVEANATLGTSSFSSLSDLGANEKILQHQTSESGLHNKKMDVDETGQRTFCVPVLQYNCMVDKTTMDCQQNYKDEDGSKNTKSSSAMSSPGCNYEDLVDAMTKPECNDAALKNVDL